MASACPLFMSVVIYSRYPFLFQFQLHFCVCGGGGVLNSEKGPSGQRPARCFMFCAIAGRNRKCGMGLSFPSTRGRRSEKPPPLFPALTAAARYINTNTGTWDSRQGKGKMSDLPYCTLYCTPALGVSAPTPRCECEIGRRPHTSVPVIQGGPPGNVGSEEAN
jgi:hypothetical protein